MILSTSEPKGQRKICLDFLVKCKIQRIRLQRISTDQAEQECWDELPIEAEAWYCVEKIRAFQATNPSCRRP